MPSTSRGFWPTTRRAPSKSSPKAETWTAGPEHEGRYFKVRATAKSGIPGLSVAETPAGKVLAEGACTLSSVKIANASKGAMDTGAVLQAVAYTADDWGVGRVAGRRRRERRLPVVRERQGPGFLFLRLRRRH